MRVSPNSHRATVDFLLVATVLHMLLVSLLISAFVGGGVTESDGHTAAVTPRPVLSGRHIQYQHLGDRPLRTRASD